VGVKIFGEEFQTQSTQHLQRGEATKENTAQNRLSSPLVYFVPFVFSGFQKKLTPTRQKLQVEI
jgi:hypothetical protein